MLQLQFIGNLGQDVQYRVSGNREFAVFSVAVTEVWRNAQGLEQRTTKWIDCVRDGKAAVDQYLRKGTQIWARGGCNAKLWTDKNGQPNAQLQCHVYQLELLSSPKSDDSNKPF